VKSNFLVKDEGFRLLRFVLVLRTGACMDFQFAELGASQFSFGEHTPYRITDQAGGILLPDGSGCIALQPTHIASVILIFLVFHNL